MTKVLNLSVMGPLRIHRDDTPLSEPASAKAQALLCYLAVSARPFSRQALAGLLWGDLPEADARRNLRGVLMKLRQELDPYLLISHQTLAFNRDSAYTLDLNAFQTLLARPSDGRIKPDNLRQAIALYRGDFLEDFHLRQAPAFEEWLTQQRSELRKMMVEALQTLTAVSLQSAAYEEGITAARHHLTLEPADEAAHRQLMRLLALSGQRSAALNQFDQCRSLLHDELGIEPTEETAVLRDQIRADALLPATAPPPTPPHPHT
jgi:DNA-binding SARP family transcriptional activator